MTILTRPLDQTERDALAELFILFAERGREIRCRQIAGLADLDNADSTAAKQDLGNSPLGCAPVEVSNAKSSQTGDTRKLA